MLKICVSGACGKMGTRIINLAEADSNLEVIYGLEYKGNPAIGKIIEGVKIVDNCEVLKECDCLIEFATPLAGIEHLTCLVNYKKPAVIGTTGFEPSQTEKIKEAAKHIPIVFAPNMSVGVNLLFRLVELAAKKLKGYKIYIEEAHHVHKKDAPSGTAKKIVEIINGQGFCVKNEEVKVIREEEIVGDHAIVFENEFDRIEIAHSAKTRDIFAQGALVAANWIIGKKPGLYSMQEVLF